MTNPNTHSDNQHGNGEADGSDGGGNGDGGGGLEWNKSSRDIMDKWRRTIQYNETIFHFLLHRLKKTEKFFSWVIIVVSTISSSISLVQFAERDIPVEVVLGVKALITGTTILTTLIAAWLKKNDVVNRIGSCEKYLHRLRRVRNDIDYYSALPTEILRREISFERFSKTFKIEVSQSEEEKPMISPDELIEIQYVIVTYHPDTCHKLEWGYDNRRAARLGYRVRYRKGCLMVCCNCACFSNAVLNLRICLMRKAYPESFDHIVMDIQRDKEREREEREERGRLNCDAQGCVLR